MTYIKEIYIKGFKKFKELDLNLKKDTNIIVGENEQGKSTILEAIDVVVNQKYKNIDKYIVRELLNQKEKENFKLNPNVENLPKIYIELELDVNDKKPSNKKYYGTQNRNNRKANGIVFKCELDTEYVEDLLPAINNGNIPYEYYKLEWIMFSGESYNVYKKSFNTILIDSSTLDSNSSFNYYNKSLFYSKHQIEERLSIKDEFRNGLIDLLTTTEINDFKKNIDNIKFGINYKKVILENILTIYEDDIPIENKGKGMENIIKTNMALERENFEIDTVLLEEPENNLSYSNLLKMIRDLSLKSKNRQLIITTHESLIASRLDLRNIIWISNSGKPIRLENIEKSTAEFFIRADDNKFLQFLLSEKIILVEGPTEYLLIPKFYEQKYKRKLEDDNISIISCGGISYKRYLDIAQSIGKKVCVITDNDEKQEVISKINEFNLEYENQKIFTDSDINNWTWEICVYNKNKDMLDSIITVEEGSKYVFKGKNYEDIPYLGKMLNNKVDIALEMVNKESEWIIPDYVTEALEWIR